MIAILPFYITIGLHSIKIMMHNNIIRTLGNVQHVSNLNKKLIFFGTLDSNSYKLSAEVEF